MVNFLEMNSPGQSSWSRNGVSVALSDTYDVLSALIVDLGTDRTCRVINSRFSDIGVFSGANSLPRSVFYLIASLGSATSDMVNCEVSNTHHTPYATQVGSRVYARCQPFLLHYEGIDTITV